MRRLSILDTTLRDGEQSPDVRLSPREKVRIARQLERLGVDMIECGFPITSPGDAEATRLMAREIRDTWLRPIARCAKPDIDAAFDAVKDAPKPRMALFISTSALHIHHKLRSSEEAVLRQAADFTRYAVSKGIPVDFAAEDASRTDLDYLTRFFAAVAEAGAEYLIYPDTVGYATPEEMYSRLTHLRTHIPGARFSVHCHNDIGLAVINTLTAVRAGVDMVEGTINGIGERAGNVSLDEVIMALKVRQDTYQVDISHIRTSELTRTSRLVARLTGMRVAPNKAVVGLNAFRHESGIHQDGVLKNPMTYHVMQPEEVGQQLNALVLGKHSGRHAFQKKLELLGFNLDAGSLAAAFTDFKRLCDVKKRPVSDRELADIARRYQKGAEREPAPVG